ncbi:MAG TPA: TatD family hydrolase [Planctomycetaceae bacterium]|nr:TatD family hydrolase [Planctomycetaceae bacterium]
MQLIDTHLHLDEEAFRPDRDEVVARAAAAGVGTMISIGITVATSRAAVALARTYPDVYAAVAIQPNYVSQAAPGDWEIIQELATQSKVVAVGETGLDRYWDHAPFDLQVEFFDKHLELAQRLNLPFIVHCREAEKDVVAQLRRAAAAGPLRGVMHSFCGDAETAQACVELGLFISFAGMLTFKKNDALRAVAAQVPLDRLLVETDAPYLAPTPFRGKRNEPAYVRNTAEVLASIRKLTLEEIAQVTTDNARRLFAFKEPAVQSASNGPLPTC